MPRREVEFLGPASTDLYNIIRYIISEHGLRDTALAYVDRIESRCLELGDWPHAGRQRDDIGSGFRSVPFESVLIVYRVSDQRVTIVRVLGQSQDLHRHLKR